MNGYSSSPRSYFANLSTALATAVDAGVAGADEAWDRMYSSAVVPDFTNNPIWAVIPRIKTAGKPSVNFSASLTTVQSGESATLSWSSNATSCTASGAWSGSKALSGSQSVSPTATSTYTLQCAGTSGSTSRSVTVTVASPQSPTVSVSASPASITTGDSTTLSWTSSNATSCTASGAWSGSKATSGSQTVSPTSTSTYSLSCTGTGGSASGSTTVTVTSATAPSVSLSASPASIASGGISTLNWSSSNTTSCTASGAWSGSKATSGSQTVSPDSTSTYTLNCSGTGGSAISSTTVTVRAGSGGTPSLQTAFGSLSVGSDPADWLDTAEGNSLSEDDSLFKILSLDGQRVFGTTQTRTTNIHSHYVGAGSDSWSNYQYSGRMRISAASDTIGITFLSDYPNSDSYYRLRREKNTSFYLSPHGTGIGCSGTTDSRVTPTANTWYRFSIQAEDLGDRTAIRGKIWAEGSTEPAAWQIDCEDTGTRRNMGTVGVWGVVSGSDAGAKYWGDLRVEALGTSTPTDSDGDGLSDSWELIYYDDLDAISGTSDSDNDGLTAAQEQTYGTDPTLADSDGDGDSDGQEIAYGSDPLLVTDSGEDHRPAMPAIQTPPASVPLLGHVFEAGGFSDPDGGDELAESQWQIASDAQFTELLLDRTLAGRTALEVALGVLEVGGSYQIRTRQKDSTGLWSEWSPGRPFSMVNSDANDSDADGIDDRYQVHTAVDTNANGIDDKVEGMCNLADVSGTWALGFEASNGSVRCTSVMSKSELPTGLTSADFPFGMFSFGVEGLTVDTQNPATVEVSVYFPYELAADTRWYKYDPSTQQVSDFTDNVTITGNKAVLRLTDGGLGDADGVVNGRIVDPSGPVSSTSTVSPPSLTASSGGGSLGLLGLLWLLVLIGITQYRRGVTRRPCVVTGNRQLSDAIRVSR